MTLAVKRCVYCGGSDHPMECGQPIERRDEDVSETLQTYTLELIGPVDDFERSRKRREDWERIWATYFRETEENLTDLLPDGYSVRIREWDAKEDNPQ